MLEKTSENRQAGVEVTLEMIRAGVGVFDSWEPDHIFDEQGGVAEYAKRELVEALFRIMSLARYPSEREIPKA
jgi:hypothetical protein